MISRSRGGAVGALDPVAAPKDVFRITGPAAMPPKWALFCMRSHRTIEHEPQLLGITDTCRSSRIPLNAAL